MSKFFQQSARVSDAARERTEFNVADSVDTLPGRAEPKAVPGPSSSAAATPTAVSSAVLAAVKTVREIGGSGDPIPESGAQMKTSPYDFSVFSQGDFVQPIAEAYRTLRTRLLRAQASRGIRSVVITSSVMGEGKTFTSNNTAVCLAQLHNTRVLLVDGDLRTGGLSHLYKEEQNPGLADALEGRCDFADVTMSTQLKNLHFIPMGESEVNAAELFAGARWKQFMEWATANFSMTLVDAPPLTMLSDTELITASCDAVLAVVRTRRAPREVVEQAAHRIEKQKLLGVVLNCVDVGRMNGYGRYYNSYTRRG
jgi:capsular exopolysaccharide synthesis family protein